MENQTHNNCGYLSGPAYGVRDKMKEKERLQKKLAIWPSMYSSQWGGLVCGSGWWENGQFQPLSSFLKKSKCNYQVFLNQQSKFQTIGKSFSNHPVICAETLLLWGFIFFFWKPIGHIYFKQALSRFSREVNDKQ